MRSGGHANMQPLSPSLGNFRTYITAESFTTGGAYATELLQLSISELPRKNTVLRAF